MAESDETNDAALDDSMVIVVMGVSGSGKSTVGQALATAIGGRFYDADDYHSLANVQKMRNGEALTEADREPWLRALRSAIDEWLTQPGVSVLACSALKQRYRERLRVDGDKVRLVHLRGSPDLIRSRMSARNHFMPAGLLESQYETLEPPSDALNLDINEPVAEIVTRIRNAWNL